MRTIISIGLLLAAGVAQAETNLYGHFGVAFGGERLVTVEFEDGSDEDLRAGSGFALNLGLVHHIEDSPFSLQTGIGYFTHTTSAANSNARFSRYPLEVLGFWNNGDHRFGGGLVHHMSPTLNLDNLGGKVSFDAASGFALEYGYRFFSVRYTTIDYSYGGFDIGGESIGAYLSMGY